MPLSKRLIVGALTIALLDAAPARAQATAYVVIVNAANPVSTLSRAQTAEYFFKKKGSWDGGQPVVPVDQNDAAPVRKAFSTHVLGREVYSVKSYWQGLIFSGRAVPPIEKSSDADVIAFVAGNTGAIGYVSPSATLGNTVKVVKIE